MHSLCKVYVHHDLFCCGTLPSTLSTIVVVSTPDSVSFGPVPTVTCPVLLEPDCGFALTVVMLPLHKLALHDVLSLVGQRNCMTANDPEF
jgi:hypothetical protein